MNRYDSTIFFLLTVLFFMPYGESGLDSGKLRLDWHHIKLHFLADIQKGEQQEDFIAYCRNIRELYLLQSYGSLSRRKMGLYSEQRGAMWRMWCWWRNIFGKTMSNNQYFWPRNISLINKAGWLQIEAIILYPLK